jgi:hypothetical protein
MDISAQFVIAWKQLRKYPALIIPQAIGILVSIVALLVFLQLSGASALLADYHTAQLTYAHDPAVLQDYTVNVFGEQLFSLFTVHNLLLALSVLTVSFIIGMYFSTLSYAAIAAVQEKKKPTVRAVFTQTHTQLLSHTLLRILELLILLVPLAILAGIAAAAYFGFHPLLLVLILIPYAIALIAYMIYVNTRLTFTTPVLFRERVSAVNALRRSWSVTYRQFKDAFIIVLIAFVFSVIVGQLTQRPIAALFEALSFSAHTARIIATSIIAMFFILVHAAAFVLRDLFIFNAYNAFPKKRGKK